MLLAIGVWAPLAVSLYTKIGYLTTDVGVLTVSSVLPTLSPRLGSACC